MKNQTYCAVFVLSWAQKKYPNFYISQKLLNNVFGSLFFVDSSPEYFLNSLYLSENINKIYWVGDGDSSKYPNSCLPFNASQLNSDKDESDFYCALNLYSKMFAVEKFHRILVLGGFGGRKDHELCNLLEINSFVIKYQSKVLVQIDLHAYCFNQDIYLKLNKNQTFSLIAFEPVFVEIEGAKYKGKFWLKSASHGLSNVALGYVSVKILNGKSVFLFI
jgi:thiamine pyrophosphokinase